MVNGDEQEFGPGDVGVVPSGHDAWVVGNEPVVVIDISGMTHYAKPAFRFRHRILRRPPVRAQIDHRGCEPGAFLRYGDA